MLENPCDLTTKRTPRSRRVRIPVSTLAGYEAGAALLAELVYPDHAADPQRQAAQRAICNAILRQVAADDDLWAWSVQRIRPGYLCQSEHAVQQTMRNVMRRLGHRLLIGVMGTSMLIQQRLKEEMPGYRKPSINRMAEGFGRFTNQSDPANFKSRVLRPSDPVFHLAIALDLYRTDLPEAPDPQTAIFRAAFADKNFTRKLIDASEVYANLMAQTPELQRRFDQLTRFQAI